ncbi:MAG: Alpha/beta hydrolase family protein [Verrucomicrobia bacterium ADurb.Bin345]|nr:MAG: Alpha/beta hydrolase family protein [Verrucomicrobia bacterium ADurb.Bin345]
MPEQRNSRKPSLVLKILRMAVLVYVGLAAVLAIGQRGFIYFPSQQSEALLAGIARKAGMEPWRSASGELVGWKTVPREGAPETGNVAIAFHGNAGFALDRLYFVDCLRGLPGDPIHTVYLFEYPGYGARPGKPSEKAICRAAAEALDELTRDARTCVYLIGESLGSGVACHLAAQHPDKVAGLFLATPFTSLGDVAKHHHPFMPVRLFLVEKYDNESALRNYAGPVAFLVAEEDEVVPARLGVRLHDGYRGPKRLWVDEGSSHNTLMYIPTAPWWVAAWDFLLTGGTATP